MAVQDGYSGSSPLGITILALNPPCLTAGFGLRFSLHSLQHWPCHFPGISKIVLRTGHHCREQCRCETGMLQPGKFSLVHDWQDVLHESRALCLARHCPARVGNLRCVPHQSHSHLQWLCPYSPCSFSSCFSSSSPPQEIIHFLSSPSHPQLFPALFSIPSLEGTSLHGFPPLFCFSPFPR